MLIHKKIKDKKGFSLVELAIVLVIIGLLMAALSKGKAILENARIKRVIGDIESITSAYNTYYDLYSAYPGDDKNASGRWASVKEGDADAFIEDSDSGGEGDGDCTADPGEDNECNEAWQALRAALMVQGDPTDSGEDALPTHPLGGRMWIWCSEATPTVDVRCDTNVDFGVIGDRNYIGISNLRGDIAEVIDDRFDDGIWNTGSVRGSADFNTNSDAVVTIYYAL